MRSCSIQELLPAELHFVYFKCDCIHRDCKCCNITATNVILLVWSTDVSGYLELPAGNHKIECISLKTSRVVQVRNVTLLERGSNSCSVSPTTSTTSQTSTSLAPSTCISPSLERKSVLLTDLYWKFVDSSSLAIMEVDCESEKMCLDVVLPVLAVVISLLVIVVIAITAVLVVFCCVRHKGTIYNNHVFIVLKCYLHRRQF